MDNKLSELSKPVAYSLRFRNMNGEPDKTINANTTFSTLEKAKAYGLGIRYVTQDDGKIVSVRDPSQDPIVEPLYSQEYVSALQHESAVNWEAAASLNVENQELKKRIAELEGQLQSGFTPEALAQEERAENAEQRVAELEARLVVEIEPPPVIYPGRYDCHAMHSAIRRAGFRVAGDSEHVGDVDMRDERALTAVSDKQRIAELEAIRVDSSQVFKEIGYELGCNPDNESIMMAIDDLKKDNTSLRDQRAGLVQAASELRAKLATPVWLTDERTLWAAEDDYDTGHVRDWNANRLEQAALLKKQGFTVERDE
ncbi:hypothetical protein V3510_005307 [Serratia marcescens]|nr:hypothetical protein [Serratia marcescens]